MSCDGWSVDNEFRTIAGATVGEFAVSAGTTGRILSIDHSGDEHVMIVELEGVSPRVRLVDSTITTILGTAPTEDGPLTESVAVDEAPAAADVALEEDEDPA